MQHLANGSEHNVDQWSCFSRLVLGEIADDIFDHDHESVDEHADRDREPAEAHQIGRHANGAHDEERHHDR